MKNLISILFFLLPILTMGQTSFKQILKESKTKNYEELVKQGDKYFQQKHPNKNKKQLSLGEFRDGEYVKYMRWQSFWKSRLTPDGKIANLPKAKAKAQSALEYKSTGLYNSIEWDNISYTADLGVQIGMGRTSAIGFHPTDPNIFYVGAAIGGIWRTADGGQTYTPLGDDLPYLSVSSIIVDQNNPSIIYIAISDRVWYGPGGIGIYKSTNGGLTWNPTALTFDFADQTHIYWMLADPTNPNKIFVGTEEGLYLTENGFATVNQIAIGQITDVKFKPGDPNTVYYTNAKTGQFYKSTDGGDSFIPKFGFTANSYMRLVTTPLNPEKVYISQNNALYKSVDSGEVFSPGNNLSAIGVGEGIVMISPANENDIYAGFFDLYLSNNDANGFIKISDWLGGSNLPLIHVDQRNAFINPLQNDRIYLCNDGGLYTINVNNGEFTNLSNGLVITQFFDIATSQTDPNVMSGGSQDNGNVFRETTTSWIMAAPTGDGMMQAIDPTNADIRYNATQFGTIYRFIDGVSEDISTNVPNSEAGTGEWVTPFVLDHTNPDRLIVGYDRIYESTDKGNTWADISGSIAYGNNIDVLEIAPSNSNRVYAIENFGITTGTMFDLGQSVSELYVKNIADNTWTTKNLPSPENVQELAIDPNDENTIYIVAAGYTAGEKVYKSTDAGDTWENISGTLANVPATAIQTYDGIPGAVFIGTDEGIFYRDNTLSDWEEYGDFPNTYITDIEIQESNKLLRVGTHGRGILQAGLPDNECLGNNPPDSDNDGVCDAFDVCDGGDDNLDANNDGVPDFCDDYCSASGTSATTTDYISYVQLNTMANTSGKDTYSDFTFKSTDLIITESHTLAIKLNNSFPLDVAYAWIDYDNDKDFESNERIIMSNFNSNDYSYGTVLVPYGAEIGTTTMRVRNIYSGEADPCGAFAGEVEDYTVNILDCNGLACDDGDPCTTGETYDANCNCNNGVFQDADNDDVCDAEDVCPNFDDALIGTICDDGNDNTLDDVYNNNCNCAGTPAGLTITSPSNNSIVAEDFILYYSTNNVNLQKYHIHVIIDGVDVGELTGGGAVNLTGLEVGTHTISLELAKNNHSLVGISDTITVIVPENVMLNAKAFLQGPYNSGQTLMGDQLRQQNFIPLQEPYSNNTAFNHNGSEQTTQAVLNTTGNNAIVDWVLVELRSKNNSGQILATRAALLQRDGDIVEVDGTSPVAFEIAIDEYYVAIRHRNHLGIMTAQTVQPQLNTTIDFTNPATATWGQNACNNIATKMVMWAGNGNSNNELIFQGASNDPNEVFFNVLTATENTTGLPNYIHMGYYAADVNMDGQAIYQGISNDPNIIFFNVLSYPQNNTAINNFIIMEQLP